MSTAVVWFRRDLRLDDNPALERALQRHERVLPVYVHAPHEEAPWAPGAASRWWLHHSLAALAADLAVRGSTLHLATFTIAPSGMAGIESGGSTVWTELARIASSSPFGPTDASIAGRVHVCRPRSSSFGPASAPVA